MSLPPPTLFSRSKHMHILPAMAQIHADCVLQDHTLATFLPKADGKMDMTQLITYWRKHMGTVDQDPGLGRRAIVLQFADEQERELAGFVCLWMPFTETGPFRAEVEKLLVSPRHRKKGVARAVMMKLEEVARVEKRELLILDTTVGSPAELVYPRLGYTRLGVIPKYGISPKDGKLVDEVWFYKDLRDE